MKPTNKVVKPVNANTETVEPPSEGHLFRKRPSFLATGALAYAALHSSVFASSTGTGLPWEGPLQTVTDSLTGPVAIAIGTIAFFVAGGMLIFGSEIGDFAKRVIYAVLAASIMLLGGNLISVLFGGATSI